MNILHHFYSRGKCPPLSFISGASVQSSHFSLAVRCPGGLMYVYLRMHLSTFKLWESNFLPWLVSWVNIFVSKPFCWASEIIYKFFLPECLAIVSKVLSMYLSVLSNSQGSILDYHSSPFYSLRHLLEIRKRFFVYHHAIEKIFT